MKIKLLINKFFLGLALIACSGVVYATEAKVDQVQEIKATDLKEDQIPLKIFEEGKVSNSQSASQKVVVSLAIIIGLLGAGYYGLKKFSFKNSHLQSNMQIKILSQHYLGPKKSLAIIRVAGESILIGVTDQNISMIKSLALLDDEIPQVLPKDFSVNMTENLNDADTEDFTFAGIKTTVSEKLKSMKSIQ